MLGLKKKIKNLNSSISIGPDQYISLLIIIGFLYMMLGWVLWNVNLFYFSIWGFFLWFSCSIIYSLKKE